jgi:hypothetical protein
MTKNYVETFSQSKSSKVLEIKNKALFGHCTSDVPVPMCGCGSGISGAQQRRGLHWKYSVYRAHRVFPVQAWREGLEALAPARHTRACAVGSRRSAGRKTWRHNRSGAQDELLIKTDERQRLLSRSCCLTNKTASLGCLSPGVKLCPKQGW